MPPTSRVFFTVKLCVGFLLPCAVYTMGVQIYLLSTHQLDFMIRPNSILLLTTVGPIPLLSYPFSPPY